MDLVQNERHTKRIKEIVLDALHEYGIVERLEKCQTKEFISSHIKDIVKEMFDNGDIRFRPILYDSHVSLEVIVRDSHGWANSRIF